MIKNDYRRSFIMLRPVRQGYGGHVRLEKRTLTGNLYFIVTAPESAGPLRAALAGQRNGQYYAAPLGALARDRRGQLTLAWPFDPRSIDGRPLEAYAWVCVAEVDGGCELALTGNVNGSREVDPAALARAVCALFEQAPAADLPAPDEAPAPTPKAPESAPAEPVGAASPESDVKIYTRARAARASGAPTPPAESAQVEVEAVATETAAVAEAAPETGAPEPRTAAAALGLDITRPWIEPAECLRRLFATQAPLDAPLGDGYTYVADDKPSPTGWVRCLVGLRSSDGQITGIRYAVPGTFAPEPPAGLEDYAWSDAGYWVLDVGVS